LLTESAGFNNRHPSAPGQFLRRLGPASLAAQKFKEPYPALVFPGVVRRKDGPPLTNIKGVGAHENPWDACWFEPAAGRFEARDL